MKASKEEEKKRRKTQQKTPHQLLEVMKTIRRENEVGDARLCHPFNLICAGATGAGKSHFCTNLFARMKDMINVEFDYIVLFIGTKTEENNMVRDLLQIYPDKISVVEVNESYPSDSELIDKFPSDFESHILPDKIGCVVFDDLMQELATCNLLVPLFTKFSSHRNVSSVHITQNLFFKSKGKRGGDQTTLYRNAQYLVLFKNNLDNTIFQNVARRLKSGKYKIVQDMFEEYSSKYRYIFIDGKMLRTPELMFRTDIFGMTPDRVPYQRILCLNT